MRSGFVSIVGRPNVGKSTLLNTILDRKIAIVSDKAQTTRNNIMGIYHEDDAEIIFIDTPGIHKPKHNLGKALNSKAYYSINDVDIILLVVDISLNLGPGDKFVIDKLKDINKPVILVLNKIDKIRKETILNKINEYKDLYDFCEIVPVSVIDKKDVLLIGDLNSKIIRDIVKDKNINLEVSEEILFDYYNIDGNTSSLSKNLFDGIISNIVKSLEQGKHVAIALSDFDIIVDGFEERINNSHVMSIVSVLDNGLLEVDSWGKKCYIDLKNVTKSASQITISELSLNEK